MNILFIIPTLSYRGAEGVNSILINQFIKNNHSVTAIYAKFENFEISPNSQNVKNILPPVWLNQILRINILYMIFSPLVIIYYVIKHRKKYDAVFSDNYPCFFGAAYLNFRYKTKTYLSLHGIELNHFLYRSKFEILFFKIINIQLKLLKNYFTGIITNSPKTTRLARQLFNSPNIYEILPPLNISKLISNKPLNLKIKYSLNQRLILLVVGVIHKMKNQQLAIDVLEQLLKKGIPSTLFLVGPGNWNNINLLKIPAHCIEHIKFFGQVPIDDLGSFYQSCDILLQCGYYPEGLGLTPFEAMLFGKCTLTAQGSGAAEIIESEQIGYIAPPNTDAFYNKVLEFQSQPEKFQQLSQRAYQYVIKHMTQEIYFQSILTLINRI